MGDIESVKFRQFEQLKKSCLEKDDLSRKGSIDEPIRPLVDIINKNAFYYTTSTCSGRITLIAKPYLNSALKKGGHFYMNSHEHVSCDELYQILESIRDEFPGLADGEGKCLWLKFEPFIMHIQCYSLEKAKILLDIALKTGCRNSGITLGKNDKFMVAIRSTSSMEIPLHCANKFNLERNYVEFLSDECNQRMTDSFSRLSKFQTAVESDLE